MLARALGNSLDLPRSCLARFEKNRKFMKISLFRGHATDLSVHRKFSQGMGSTQRMHFWIAFDLKMKEKLLRSQLNTQLLRFFYFCDRLSHTWCARPTVNECSPREGLVQLSLACCISDTSRFIFLA